MRARITWASPQCLLRGFLAALLLLPADATRPEIRRSTTAQPVWRDPIDRLHDILKEDSRRKQAVRGKAVSAAAPANSSALDRAATTLPSAAAAAAAAAGAPPEDAKADAEGGLMDPTTSAPAAQAAAASVQVLAASSNDSSASVRSLLSLVSERRAPAAHHHKEIRDVARGASAVALRGEGAMTAAAPITSDSDFIIGDPATGKILTCPGGSGCKLMDANAAAAANDQVVEFRKGYRQISGAESGDTADTTEIAEGDTTILTLGTGVRTDPTLDCAHGTCTYQNHAGTGTGHWGSPKKIESMTPSGTTLQPGSCFILSQMKDGYDSWADWFVTCDTSTCSGSTTSMQWIALSTSLNTSQAYTSFSCGTDPAATTTTTTTTTTTRGNTTTTTTTEPAPQPQVAALIKTATENEVALQTKLEEQLTSLRADMASHLNDAALANLQKLDKYRMLLVESNGVIRRKVKDFALPQADRFAMIMGVNAYAEGERANMQSRLFALQNGIRRRFCPEPDFSAQAGKTTMVKLETRLNSYEVKPPLAGGKGFETWRAAWRACGETPGCGQIVKQAATGQGGAEQYTGYFLRRRMDAEAPQDTNNGYMFKPCEAEGLNCNLQISHIGANYECSQLCPAECKALDLSFTCQTCASRDGEECSECAAPGDNPDRIGCSGNCGREMIDCRDCTQ
eukprot:TRINITY_DN16239_c1_g2_i1.p1 TRINITY_DN16239_c1_g2~~TRINITY_DN16239_c1_g2_i1.p1  ORF type:complete len:682 (+),score=146.49 TRINITY_DN16239_c1_g2_i1:99-2144(+)